MRSTRPDFGNLLPRTTSQIGLLPLKPTKLRTSRGLYIDLLATCQQKLKKRRQSLSRQQFGHHFSVLFSTWVAKWGGLSGIHSTITSILVSDATMQCHNRLARYKSNMCKTARVIKERPLVFLDMFHKKKIYIKRKMCTHKSTATWVRCKKRPLTSELGWYSWHLHNTAAVHATQFIKIPVNVSHWAYLGLCVTPVFSDVLSRESTHQTECVWQFGLPEAAPGKVSWLHK